MAERRITDLTGGPPPSPPSVFATGDDNVIPGEIVFALEADAARASEVGIASIPSALSETTTVGAGAVDKVLGRLKVQSVTRVHSPAPTEVIGGVAMASELGLDTTMRVRYEADESPAAVAKKLSKLDEVAWAEPNRWREASVVPDDPRFGSQWGLTKIGCPAAWDQTVGDPAIVVAVVDTGVDLNHPELASLLLQGQDLVDFPANAQAQPGWVFEGDFTGVDAVPQDEVGHGTHVAGTICCASNNATGVAGVSWNTRLLPVRVLARIRNTTTGAVSGVGSSANIAAGIRWAVDHGARVINMSLGGSGDAQVEREAVAYAVSRGVVVVAAMGNDNTSAPSYPAAYPGVIAVGATDSADHRASFSNFGSWIDVAAPGVGIWSTYWDDTYASLSGTSMASPHVAGVAALILSRNHSLTSEQVANILRSTARPLKDDPAESVPNDRYGSGLVQADAAVAAAAPPPPKSLPTNCPSSVIGCTSTAIACLSVQTRCPSVGANCPSETFNCRSVVILCPTKPVLCRPTLGIACPPPSSPVQCPSDLVICHGTTPVICQPLSTVIQCPTKKLTCQPSVAIPCPSGAICHLGPGGDPGPIISPGSITESAEVDPYGYDPYQSNYE